jgi:hypothetical protein
MSLVTVTVVDCLATVLFKIRSQGSSGSIVADYGLDDRAIGVRSPAGAKDFSSNLCVQTGSGAHSDSCTMGTGCPFPGAKRGRGVTLNNHPYLVSRSRMSRSYTSSPPSTTWRVAGLLCLFLFKICFIARKYSTSIAKFN